MSENAIPSTAVGEDPADSTPGKAPAFQFYPNDFLADANVVVMSMQERGVYITLLCYCWQQGTLPAQRERLALLCGLPLATFNRLWPAVSVCFKPHANGERLTNPRLERERKKHRAYRKLQSDKGKLGGRPKKPELSTEKAVAFSEHAPQKSSSSSNYDLQSSSSDFSPKSAALARPSASMAPFSQTLHRGGHQRHTWCSERMCVPDFIHDRLRGQRGGPDAAAWLLSWYERVMERIGDAPIGEKPEDFWPRQFAAEFPPAGGVSKLTAALEKAGQW